jgi:DNA-binding transcriptional MerR regulator
VTGLLPMIGIYTPEQEIESLKRIVAAQELQIKALAKLIDLNAVETLTAENQDLHRLLGLRGDTVSLEQQIEERGNHGG